MKFIFSVYYPFTTNISLFFEVCHKFLVTIAFIVK